MHVITHSHLDAGWVFSVDECYTTVEHIFDSVFLSLKDDDHRIYTVGDIYFFHRWYQEKDMTEKEEIKKLVKRGQFDLVHGGAVSTDEATVNYNDIIDNMLIAREWIKTEFD